jgi:bifunctional DNA-binding transcriptional regulator/antitoxin component of YhaV-PrlF toxin-antitoxin module
MKTLMMTKRGSITLPPAFRKRLGIGDMECPLVLAEERDGKIFLQSATAVPVREIPLDTINKWMESDEAEMNEIRASG